MDTTASRRKALVDALRAGGRRLLARFLRVTVSYKSRANAVTQADHESEQAILDVVTRRFPGDDFLAEERGARRTGSRFVWVIDPLDGTLNYAHGCPSSCVSIGLVVDEKPLLGGVFDPFRGELFLAERGKGATLNGKPLRASMTKTVADSLLVTGFPYDRAERASLYSGFVSDFLKRAQDLRRSGSAALDLAWVAAGRFDGFWEFHLSPWDVAAGMLLVSEAGGRVTDFRGRPWSRLGDFGRETLATNGRIHAPMLRLMRRGAGR